MSADLRVLRVGIVGSGAMAEYQRMQPGFVVSLRASWRARGYLDQLAFEVEGDEGSLAVDLAESRDTVRLFDARAGSRSSRKAPRVPSTCELFVDEVRGAGSSGPGFDVGVETRRVIEACSSSSREGRAVPLPGRALA